MLCNDKIRQLIWRQVTVSLMILIGNIQKANWKVEYSRLGGSGSSTSWQFLSYQDGYKFVTLHIHGGHSAIRLGDQAASNIIWYPTGSHYPDTEPPSLSPILIMSSIRIGSDRYQFKSYRFGSTSAQTCGFESGDLPNQAAKKPNSFSHPIWSTQ